jgi:hypothetical protein
VIRPGDVIGFSGKGLISDLINVATYGIPRYSISHVGIVANFNSYQLLFESTTLDDEPCVILQARIAGVQAHTLEHRIATYDGKVYHYPLRKKLNPAQSQALTRFLHAKIGAPYDNIGAFRSGGVGLSWIESLLRKENLSSIYCSELIAAAHRYVGAFHTDNVSRYNPNRLVRTEIHEGILLPPRRLR